MNRPVIMAHQSKKVCLRKKFMVFLMYVNRIHVGFLFNKMRINESILPNVYIPGRMLTLFIQGYVLSVLFQKTVFDSSLKWHILSLHLLSIYGSNYLIYVWYLSAQEAVRLNASFILIKIFIDQSPNPLNIAM